MQLAAVGRGEPLTLEAFPFDLRASGDLLLERFDVASPDAKLVLQTPRGGVSRPLPAVAHFRGHLAGEADSRVYVGAQGDRLVAFLQTSAGIAYVGPDGDGSARHVLRPADSPRLADLAPVGWRCDADGLSSVPEDDTGSRGARPATAATTLAATALKEATVSIETDQELLAKFSGDANSMSAYVTTVLGAISTIYQRDVEVRLTINRIQAWTSSDPYVATSPRTQLDEVGDWWHANRPKSTYPRTIVHYMSGKAVTGGVAWIGVLCQGDFLQGSHWGGGYGVTQINGNYPASIWDLVGVAHEIGHNFGSPHTHCFSPAIDMCYGSEAGCYSGPTVNPGPGGGTIMSYCHLLSGGFANVSLRFHERCIAEKMLPEIASVGCLTTIPDAPPMASSFYTVTPCRVVDTRGASGQWGGPALAANSNRTFTFAGQCNIPSSAKAVSVNVTATQASTWGNLRLYAGGAPPPLASALNYRAGQTRANNGRAPLGADGGLAVRCDQNSGNVHVIIDVNGYFQ